jgi:hypothetical protein
MRDSDRFPQVFRLVVVALALTLSLGAAPATPPPLSAFDRFELAAVALDAAVPAAKQNERVRRQLQMHLRDQVGAWIAQRNGEPARGTPPRTLRIEPVIVALDPIDPATRAALGDVAGGTALRVRVRFVDAGSGEAVAETELQAGHPMLVNVASLDAAGAQPRRIAADLVDFLDAAVTSAPTPEPRLPN